MVSTEYVENKYGVLQMNYEFANGEITDFIAKKLWEEKRERITGVEWSYIPSLFHGDRPVHKVKIETAYVTDEMVEKEKKEAAEAKKAICEMIDSMNLERGKWRCEWTENDCPVCGKKQFKCPGGLSCENGHGFGSEE